MTSHPNRSKRKHGHAIGFDPELCADCMREQRDELLAALKSVIYDLEFGTTDRWKGNGSLPLRIAIANACGE